MSRSLNQVILIGNLTRDPEMRALPSGDEFCRFGLALSYSYNTRDGETRDGVDFVDITAWGGLASVVQNYCHKGKQIMVQGSLKSSSWEQDGQTRSKLEVRAQNILLLGSRSQSSDGGEDESSPVSTPAKSTNAKKPASKKAAEEIEDYELEEDLNYDQEGVNPEDIPF